MSIDRRQFIGLIASGIATGQASALPGAEPRPFENGPVQRPNFLFMIADDMTYRTICALNNREVHTPNLDRLVARGCAFTHCFHQGTWTAAVCVASRTMLTTGLSAFHARDRSQRVQHFEPDNLDDVRTWGQTLGAAGYDTYICGKWHLDPSLLQRSFKQMGPVAPGMLPSTSVFGGAYNRPHPANESWEPWDRSQNGQWLHTGVWENKAPDTIEHSSAIYANHAIDYLNRKAKEQGAPFFMYIGFNAPHDPRQSPQEYLDLYPRDRVEVPPNFLPQHPFDQGDFKLRDEILAPFPRTEEAVRLHRREYYAIISHLDAQIGRILDALDRSGMASQTYVIFTADHGLAVGEHGLMGKQNLYDCSVRMPLLVAGPGIAVSSKVDELVYQHSMYATTCELADIEAPAHVEFPSLAPLLRGESGPVNDAVFCCYKDYQRMVRTRTHKLIVYPQARRTQLFDIQNDPWEMHDLADDPEMATVRAGLLRRLRRFQAELGDGLDLDHPTDQAPPDAIYHD